MYHAWWSFYINKSSEIIDIYVTCITLVGAFFGYGEPQALEAFKNQIPSRLDWVLFPTNEKLFGRDSLKNSHQGKKRQHAGQSTTSLFMNITGSTGCNQKAVSFDSQNVLDAKIDKLTAVMTN